MAVILGFRTLSDTNPQIKPLKGRTSTPRHFYRGVTPPGVLEELLDKINKEADFNIGIKIDQTSAQNFIYRFLHHFTNI